MPTADDALVVMLDELVVLSDSAAHPRAEALLERLRAGDLRVALVGEAKRGKSSLGNALLGEAVLPTGVVPVTAISTEVREGSPRRAEVSFPDGTVHTTDVGDVERFVSQRRNPGNSRHVAGVRAYLPDGMPHPRMVLVDTPGVGSVHRHNTEQAQSAFAAMDAAVFVLSADPPISASELALLGEVADLAVRVFVVLNKADQLEPDELGESTGFVGDVLVGALGTAPHIWVCSARNGLRARVAGDAAAWAASGVPALLDALLAHLVAHRDRDLRVSVAATAARLAASQLDAVNVAIAAVEALDANQEHRVLELGARLDAVDQRRDQAVEVVTANLARARSALDADAAGEVGEVTRLVHERLAAFLATADSLSLADTEEQGRKVIAETTRAAVERWRGRWHGGLNDSNAQLLGIEQGLLEEAAGDLHAAAHNLLGIRLRTEIPVLTPAAPPALRYDFEPGVAWNQALVSGLRTHAPGSIGRRRVARYLRTEAGRLVDRHTGRARANFQDRLEEAGRRLRTQVADAFSELTESLRTGRQVAIETRRSAHFRHRDAGQSLDQQRAALEELTQRLRTVAGQPAAAPGSGYGEDPQAPGTGPLKAEIR